MDESDEYVAFAIIFVGLTLGTLLYGISITSSRQSSNYRNTFPIIVNTSKYVPSQSPYTVYIFNGVQQINGTACISSVQINQYIFNYTTQKYQLISNETVTNRTQLYRIYDEVSNYVATDMPGGYALLCLNIVNSTT